MDEEVKKEVKETEVKDTLLRWIACSWVEFKGLWGVLLRVPVLAEAREKTLWCALAGTTAFLVLHLVLTHGWLGLLLYPLWLAALALIRGSMVRRPAGGKTAPLDT